MPPFRLSAGKSLSPMQRPHIVAARDLRLDKVPLLPFPEPEAIELLPGDENQHFGTRLQSGLIMDFPLVFSKPQLIQAFETDLPKPVSPSQEFQPFDRCLTSGKRFTPFEAYQIIGPAPLYISDPTGQGLESPLAGKVPVMTDLLRPLLEPSVLSSEIGQLALPRPLYVHQREAVKELFKREALLLADEPGMGKTVAVCVALTALVQSGLARRCLVVCPETGFHHWVAHLHTWAPFTLFSVLRGKRAQRAFAWRSIAHIYLTDYKTLATDIEAGILAGGDLAFDVVVLDGIHAIRFQALEISSALTRLKARRRWVLTGALPRDIEDWVRIFSFLTPEKAQVSTRDTLPDFRQRFEPYVLRRSKEQVAADLPARIRQEIWLDLDERQSESYQQALAEERERLSRLGGAVAKTHITAAVDRLKKISNFAPESYDSNKVRALVDLIEEVAAAEAKMIVFSRFHEEGLERLQSVLEAYGALRLDAETPMERRDQLLEAFRQEKQWHVLLVEMGARTDGVPFTQVTHIVHFDHGWNPAIRQRAERRLHPMLGPSVPVNVYEFWVADTIDERLYALLQKRGLLPDQVPEGTPPLDLEKRVTVEDWLYEVFEISPKPAPDELSVPQEEGAKPPSSEALQQPDLSELSVGDLKAEVESLMHLMGYTELEALGEHDDAGADYTAARSGEAGVDRALVRFLRTEKNVGVQEGRRLLEEMQAREDCQAAYLVVTSDFTDSCKQLARESAGKLVLVSGSDWRHHLQSLGRESGDLTPGRMVGFHKGGVKETILANVLFVCTANQCRSPMAEALFKQILEKKGQGQGWQVGSAGILAIEGAPATDLSQAVMRQRGLELSHHRARPVSGEMLEQVDLILAMEVRHRDFLKSEFPEFAERVHLISDMTGEGHEIKDPVWGTMETYRATADELAGILDRGFGRILELTRKNGVEKV